jgi:protein-disulfide isomerase
MHFFLRRLIQRHPEKIRLVHRHFPMDHTVNPIVDTPFHAGAAKLAVVALFASENGKFWRMNDILFSIDNQAETVTVRDFAQQADIPFEAIKDVFRNQHLWAKLGKDIRDGIEYGLTGTPGYLINGQIYLGQIPAEILRKYI